MNADDRAATLAECLDALATAGSLQEIQDVVRRAPRRLVEAMGGKITKSEYWGLKSLAYRMRKNRKAHMTLLNVDAPPAALTEIERQERLNEDVLRYLTIRVEGHEEGPSAMMRKADRDREERGGRDRGERRPRRDEEDSGETNSGGEE